jgi:hypothetical protein
MAEVVTAQMVAHYLHEHAGTPRERLLAAGWLAVLDALASGRDGRLAWQQFVIQVALPCAEAGLPQRASDYDEPVMTDTAAMLADEFRQCEQVAARDFRHMLHGQLIWPWGQDERAAELCRRLIDRMRALPPNQLEQVLRAVRTGPGQRGAITMTTVLGYRGLHMHGLTAADYWYVTAAAVIICRLGDLFDAEAQCR